MKEEGKVEYKVTIRDLPLRERPRERLRDSGASNLSTTELLAILMRTGTSRENVLSLAGKILARFGGLAGLSRASFAELCQEWGVGEAKAAQILAALELGKRVVSALPEERAVVGSPEDVAKLLSAEMSALEQECLKVLLMDTKNRVLAIPEVYKGSVNTSLVRVAEVFREAIRQNCPAIIVVHNHPSGDPTPSEEDGELTRQLVAAGRLLDIEVLDHIIIGRGRHLSLRQQRLGFES